MRRAGYVRVRVDGNIADLSEEIELDTQKTHPLEVVVDRLLLPEEMDPSFRQRVTDSLETTLKLGSGIVLVSIMGGDELLFSEHPTCVACGISLPEIAPHTFSFNSPHGACPTCAGLGVLQTVDPEQVAHTSAMGSEAICPHCHGPRLKPESLPVTVGGRTIAQMTHLSIAPAHRFIHELVSANQPFIEPHDPLVALRLSERER